MCRQIFNQSHIRIVLYNLYLFKSFGQPGRGQPDVQGSQLGSDYDRSRRNRSLDRSTELEQFNSGMRGSSRGLHGPGNGAYSGSTTHLNLQLGPLQLPPRGYGHTYQMVDCKSNFTEYFNKCQVLWQPLVSNDGKIL